MIDMQCRPVATDDDTDEDGVRWLALVIAEMLRVGLALLAKRYPEARATVHCPKCGHRH